LPEVEAVLARKIHPPILMPGEIDFSGTLPAGAHTLSIRLPYILGETMHVYELPNGGSIAAAVAPGDYSEEIQLPPREPPKTGVPPGPEGGRFLRILPKALKSALFVIGLSLLCALLVHFFRNRKSVTRNR
jgi:hypothetical protein